MQVELIREPGNLFNQNAVKIVINRKTVIGYVPRGFTSGLTVVMDAGLKVKAELLQIIGGYSYKENYGCLINISI